MVDKILDLLVFALSLDIRVQLKHELCDDLTCRLAKILSMDKKVLANVALSYEVVVHNQELADSRKHEILESLGSGSGCS